MALPLTLDDLLQRIAVETARMSYPGSMSRGMKPVVSQGTKLSLESYFRTVFPIQEVWSSAASIANQYDTWHRNRVDEIVGHIDSLVSPHNVSASVAAKFLNTFMHQLMKYEQARPLFPCLHLPLDARVFTKLARIKSQSLESFREIFRGSPYSIPYSHHEEIQTGLLRFLEELNARPRVDFRLASRIELNWLWL